MSDERRQQAIDQCLVVIHMATALSETTYALQQTLEADHGESLIEHLGRQSAVWMEMLGDMLNGIDAVTEEDEWITPIFEKSREMWPTPKTAERTP